MVNPEFDLYQLGAEHEALRAALRAMADKEIAPQAASTGFRGLLKLLCLLYR
ncbi:MAG: hypothetical protein ACRDTC_09695 [Pseudonocardiaceae bacterium]